MSNQPFNTLFIIDVIATLMNSHILIFNSCAYKYRNTPAWIMNCIQKYSLLYSVDFSWHFAISLYWLRFGWVVDVTSTWLWSRLPSGRFPISTTKSVSSKTYPALLLDAILPTSALFQQGKMLLCKFKQFIQCRSPGLYIMRSGIQFPFSS